MAGLTPKLPLTLGSSENGTYKLLQNYKDLIKQNFKNLIFTAPGERMMDPNFGVGIKKFLFENDGPELYSSISARIDEQVDTYMPFIIITDISFVTPQMAGFQGQPNNFLSMRIEYAIGPLDEYDNLDITTASD